MQLFPKLAAADTSDSKLADLAAICDDNVDRRSLISVIGRLDHHQLDRHRQRLEDVEHDASVNRTSLVLLQSCGMLQ